MIMQAAKTNSIIPIPKSQGLRIINGISWEESMHSDTGYETDKYKLIRANGI